MKKVLVLGVSALSILALVTGCGQKESTLVCKQTANGVDVTFNVGFKGNTIHTMDFSYDMDLSQYTDAQIEAIKEQDFCTSVKESMSSYKDAFTDCNQEIAEKHLTVSSELDVNKIATSVLDKMGTPKATKQELEEEGYSCTIQ